MSKYPHPYCENCVRRREGEECNFKDRVVDGDCVEYMDEYPMDNSHLSFRDALYPGGISSRKEYTKYIIGGFIVQILLLFIPFFFTVVLFLELVVILYMLAVSVRRLNDIGIGWKGILLPLALLATSVVLMSTLPALGGLAFLLYDAFFILLFFIKGQKGINRYGANPVEDFDTQLYGGPAKQTDGAAVRTL